MSQVGLKKYAFVGDVLIDNDQARTISRDDKTVAELAKRPEIAGLVYFDHVDPKAKVDWRIDGDPAAVRAWTDAFLHRSVVRTDAASGVGAN